VDEKKMRSAVRGLLPVGAILVGLTVVGCAASEGLPNADVGVDLHERGTAATGNGPVALAVGDLNQDQLMDVLVVNGLENSLSVYIQRTGGGLPGQPTVSYPTGASPSAVAVTDLNGDGWPEVLVTNAADNSLSVFKNPKLSDGTLQTDTPYSMIPTPIAVAAADVNGDGRSDVVISSGGDAPLTVLRNNGSGMLFPEPPVAGAKLSYGLTLAQFSTALLPDLVLTSAEDNVVRLFQNDGSGNFMTGPRELTGTWATPVAIVAAQLDDDGSKDLLVANYTSNQVTMLLNRGNYLFAATNLPTGRRPVAVAVGDLDGDSQNTTDFAVLCQDHVEVWLNYSSGTFVSITNPQGLNTLSFGMPSGLAIAPVNGDGGNNILVIDRLNNKLSILGVGAERWWR